MHFEANGRENISAIRLYWESGPESSRRVTGPAWHEEH